MNQRELSEKLDTLATRLDNLDNVYQAHDIATELRKLSNENYAPGNSTTWDAIKPSKPTKKTFTDKTTGRKLPF